MLPQLLVMIIGDETNQVNYLYVLIINNKVIISDKICSYDK